MCGIVGKYNFRTNEPVDPGLINTMCERIVYRGPDDGGVYVDGPLGLGHRRLSIIDLSSLGHQPMSTQDKSAWITFNGEIYNFQELRKDLINKGYHFSSQTDTEVVLYLYKEYGEKCLDHMRGMFAFGIWDADKSTLFLARDRIGKKPLFYYYNGRSLIFASEIKSILEDGIVDRKINIEALADYFKYGYVPDPKSIYHNIFKLKPGHFILCSPEGMREQSYWDVSFSDAPDRDLDTLKRELLEVLNESVRLRMISDVPLGAFLSGGIDSSGVVALMAMQSYAPVITCSIGFDSEDYDEIRFARRIAEQYRTDHHEFTVKQNSEEILQNLAFHFDEPFADSSAVPTYYVSKLAQKRVKVALSGDGGDENFAGYEKYFLDDVENRIRQRIPKGIRESVFPALYGLLALGNGRMLRRGATLLRALSHGSDYGFYLSNTEFEEGLWSELANEDLRRSLSGYDPFSVTQYYYNKADTDSHLSKILYVDLKTYLPGDILVKVDRMSMAHSLEVRAPLLDHHVIEFAAKIPPALKYNRGEKKYVLKQAFSQILPPEIMNRRKMGFSVPLADWFRSELRGLAHSKLFSKKSGISSFFNVSRLDELWGLHQAGVRDYSAVLYSLLMFELWHRSFMN